MIPDGIQFGFRGGHAESLRCLFSFGEVPVGGDGQDSLRHETLS